MAAEAMQQASPFLSLTCSGENRGISNAENPPNCASGIREFYVLVYSSVVSQSPYEIHLPFNTALVLFPGLQTILFM